MDLFNKFKDLVKESLQCKSFKGLSVVSIILCSIILAPFIAVYACGLLIYWLIATVYRFGCNMLDYVHAFVKKERSEVRHGTEVVIYLVAFPTLFLMKLINAILALVIMLVHLFVSLVGYIATLGGIRFSPFLYDDVDRLSDKAAVTHCKAAVIVFIVIGLVLVATSVFWVAVADKICEQVTLNKLINEMQTAEKAGKISRASWNEFADAYNGGKINLNNYKECLSTYLGDNNYSANSFKTVESFGNCIAPLSAVFTSLYISFTALYVSIYANAVKRRKAVCEAQPEEISEVVEA